MMTSTDPLRWYLEKSIQDRIASLERRIRINAKTQIALNKKDLSPSATDAFHLNEGLQRHHLGIDQIINECNEHIAKMRLIRSFLHLIELQLLLHLFHKNANYSYKDMWQLIQTYLQSDRNDVQDHLMVA
ncbi:MAG: hypothetical protein AAF985_22590 [Bacteroidota bacterium]